MKKEIVLATVFLFILLIFSCCSAASNPGETAAATPSAAPSPSVIPVATATPSETADPEKGSSTESSWSGSTNPMPFIYRDGSDVYLAVGAKSIKLDDTALSQGSLNASVSPGNDTLYYLSNAYSSSGEGDLMRISLGNADAKPERIAESVYSARISADGERILYLTDIKKGAGEPDAFSTSYGAGKLNICSPGGEPTVIGDTASDMCYGFSLNGSYAYYVVRSNGKSTLMLYSGNETKELYSISGNKIFDSIYVDDSGRVLFAVYSKPQYDLYLYEGGNAKLVKANALITFVFGNANDFLYYSPYGRMGYFLQGNKTTITKDAFCYVRFPAIEGDFTHLRFPGNVHRYDPREVPKHFLYAEATSGGYMLYEISLPGEGIEIGKSDDCSPLNSSYRIDSGFRYVAHKFENTLYLAKKTSGKWEDVKVCLNPSYFEFDDSGDYLYYIEGVRSGDLCRISTSTGEAETLLKDAVKFLLWQGDCYAVNVDYEVYLVKNGKDSQKLENGIYGLYPGEGGVYAMGRDIFFLSGGKSEKIASDAGLLEISG